MGATTLLLVGCSLRDFDELDEGCEHTEVAVDGRCLEVTEPLCESDSPREGSACGERSGCPPGTFIHEVDADSNPVTCLACPEDTFSASKNAPECSPHQTCPPGTGEVETGSTTSDRRCEQCTPGQYSSDGFCIALTDCPAGSFISTPAGPAQDRVCSPCPSGMFSDSKNAATCTPHSICPADQVEQVAPSSIQDRSCAPCQPEHFLSEEQCHPATQCSSSEYEAVALGPHEDRVCLACGTSTWIDDVSEPFSVCVPHGRLQNRLNLGRFLSLEEGVTARDFVPGATEPSSRRALFWTFEETDGYFRIRHLYDRSMYLYRNGLEVTAGPIRASDLSAQWQFELVDDPELSGAHAGTTFLIRNREAPHLFLRLSSEDEDTSTGISPVDLSDENITSPRNHWIAITDRQLPLSPWTAANDSFEACKEQC